MDEGISTTRGMGPAAKSLIVLLLVAAIAGTFYLKNRPGPTHNPVPPNTSATSQTSKAALPRLLDIGSDKCIPCKLMAPILEELQKDFAGRFTVEFIDAWKNPAEAGAYSVEIIPTQIFFDAAGQERFRHQGFFSREDILAKWKELGVDIQTKP